MKLSIYIKKSKTNSKGEAPIYCRIITDNSIKEFSVKRNINPDRWELTNSLTNSKATSEEKKIRHYIDEVITKLEKFAIRSKEDSIEITAESVYNSLFNKEKMISKTLLDAWELHKVEFFKQVERGELEASSYKKYNSVKKLIIQYVKERFNLSDVFLSNVDNDFQKNFHSFLIGKVNQNTISKYVQHLRTVISFAHSKGFINQYKLEHYKIKKIKVKKIALTPFELNLIATKEFSIQRMEVIKDIFLFNCLTGYAFTDLSRLTYKDIEQVGNIFIIKTSRDKTKIEENVPLTDEAIYLLNKYKNHPDCINKGLLFPFISNQKTNVYLKELADVCGIDKVLTSKVARNTYATNGIRLGMNLKILSTLMGHTNIRQTEDYGTIFQESQISEMKKMNSVLNLKMA